MLTCGRDTVLHGETKADVFLQNSGKTKRGGGETHVKRWRLKGGRVTKVKERRPLKAVRVLVLVLSVVAHSRRSCTTCSREKREETQKEGDG